MLLGRLKAHLSRPPALADYMMALGLAGVAVLFRSAMEAVTPGVVHFITVFPAVVLAGVFCGTGPAVACAAAGGISIAVIFGGGALLEWPPFNAAQASVLAFLPACATVLWAASVMRRFAVDAAAAEARLAEVFRQIPGAAAILEAPAGRLLLRSAQSESVLGQPERRVERSSEMANYGGIHPDGRPFAADDYPIVRALKTGELFNGEQIRYRRPNGEIADLEVYAGPVRGAGGRVVASVGMAFDVSDKVEAGRRLRESEARARATSERLRAALDAGALGLWELDLASERYRLDEVFAAMLGLPAQPVEMPRAELRRLIAPDHQERAIKTLTDAIAAGGPYADEVCVITARNARRWLVTRGAVFADDRKVIGVVSDVTERREREEALQAALTARTTLMREADHRIKNSLQLVVALLRLQIGRVPDADAKAALGAAMTRVNAVADAHLALQQSPDLRSIDVDRMLADLCGRVGSLNPSVTTNFEGPGGIWLDAEQAIPLGLIASELLTNALRHAFRPGAAGAVTVTTSVERGVLGLTVADQGVGLPTTPARPGLGTTIIETLARQIRATVTRQSQPGAGTTITLRMEMPDQPEPDVGLSDCSVRHSVHEPVADS